MDYISIKNLEVFSRQGVFEGENRLGQKYAIDMQLYLDTKIAGISENIDESIDYAKVCHFVNAFVKGHNYKLIESAAERLNSILIVWLEGCRANLFNTREDSLSEEVRMVNC